MSTSLGYSELSQTNTINNEYDGKKNQIKNRKNKTYKKGKKKITSEHMTNFLNLTKDMGNNDSTDGSGLADFNPPPPPVLTKQPDEIMEDEADNAISQQEYGDLDDYAANQQYYNKYIPYTSNSQNNANLSGNKDKLFEKINYMIHLLEETKDQKTQNVTEELVLYMFLGVFVIFVVDSFARSGKYIR
jgi:hypothetical protein